jgi:hypothetical protein
MLSSARVLSSARATTPFVLFLCAVDGHVHVPAAACGFVERRSGQAHFFLIFSQLPF